MEVKVDLNTVGEGEFTCEKCNSKTFCLHYVPPHVGLYCTNCGKWITWLPKKAFGKWK